MMVPTATMAAGLAMFVMGLAMFYSVEIGQTEPVLRFIKNAGIFIGLTGIGAAIAGMLLALMARSQAAGR